MGQCITLINQHVTNLFVDIANEYANNGYDVKLVCGNVQSNSSELNQKVKVVKLNPYNRGTILTRMFSWVIFGIRAAFYLFVTSKSDLMISSNPPFMIFISPLYSFLFRKRIFFVLYDLYPEALAQNGFASKRGIISRIWKWLNMKSFQRVDLVFTISTGLGQLILKDYQIPEYKVCVVPPWAEDIFNNVTINGSNWFAEKYGLSNKKVIIYSGNLGITHDIESILKAAKIMHDNNSDVVFLIIGGGAKEKWVNGFLSDYKLSNVIKLPFQDIEVLPFSFTSAQIGIVTLGDGSEMVSVPSKTYWYLSAGLAILGVCKEKAEVTSLIQRHNCGVQVLPGDPHHLSNTIEEMFSEKNKIERFCQNSKEAAKSYTKRNARHFFIGMEN